MKCSNCGGRLEGDLTICPYCETRQDVDLAQIHYRNLGPEENLPCPECDGGLEVIEFETASSIQIDRCRSCFGLFFDPGELETLLEAMVGKAFWIDRERITQIAENFGHKTRQGYRRCPVCQESMNKVNFGHQSAVLVDQCKGHGFWLQGGELRQIMEWWHAGGRLVYLRNGLEIPRFRERTGAAPRRRVSSKPPDIELPDHWDGPGPVSWLIWQIVTAIFD